jgi:hypothetical protein
MDAIDPAGLDEAINRVATYLDYRNVECGETETVIHGYWDGVDTLEAALTDPDVELLLNAVRLYRPTPAVLVDLPPWVPCTCGHSPHKHGTGEVPPPLGSHCYAGEDVRDMFRTCSCEGYTPVEEPTP